jgi:hypothetical protein
LRRRRMRLNFGVRLSCASAVSKHNSDRRLRHVHHLLLLLPTGRRPAARRRHRSRRPRDPLSLLRRTLLLRLLGRRPASDRRRSRHHRADEPKLTRCPGDRKPRENGRAPPASSRARRYSPTTDPSSRPAAHFATFSPTIGAPSPPDGRPEYDPGELLLLINQGQERERSGPGPVAPPAAPRHLGTNSARGPLLRCWFERAESAICLCRKA